MLKLKLNRSNIVFDAFNFEGGDDFRDSIRNGLDNCEVLVLFASRRALDSIWVQFEINEAEMRLIEGKIENIIVMTLGQDISFEDIPTWLKRSLIIQAPGPVQAARLIQDKIINKKQTLKPIFVGREDELKQFSEKIGEYGLDMPQIISFTGLDGVGRRTFAKYALEQNLSLGVGPVINMNGSKGFDDLYLELMNENMEVLSKRDIEKVIQIFRELNEEEQAQEIARQFSLFANYNVAPVLVDKGALLTDEGEFTSSFKKFEEALKSYPETFIILVQNWHPKLPWGMPIEEHTTLPFRVKPLSLKTTTRLLQMYLMKAGIRANNEQVSEIASYLDGYPTAVIYAKNYIEEYGIENIIADKTLLTDFKARAFTEYLKRLNLSEELVNLLKTLETIPPVTLNVLAEIVSREQSNVAADIRYLTDKSVVQITEGMLSIAPPIREAVRRTLGVLPFETFHEIANRLKQKFWDNDLLPDIATLEVLIFSLLRANRDKDLEEFKGIIMPSTLLKAARAAYDNREWGRARDLSKYVLQLDSKRNNARVILFKALVRQNENSDEVLRELRDIGHKSAHYLAGFRELKKGDYKKAIKHYEKAILSGDESNPVFRELAECQYWLGDFEAAEKSISKILNRGKPNPFVLDLAAKISTQREDFSKAEEFISIQELVDRPENVAHRKAALYAAKGLWEKALSFSDKALLRIPPLPEIFFLRIRILIELDNYDEANKSLNEVNNLFKGTRTHVQLGLKCKLLLKKGEWREADVVYERISNKETPVNRGLRAQILRLKIEDKTINLLDRRNAQKELQVLEQQKVDDIFEKFTNFDYTYDEE